MAPSGRRSARRELRRPADGRLVATAAEDMQPRNRGHAPSLRYRAVAGTQAGGRVAAHRRSRGSRSQGVLDGCHSGMSVTQEESFGPVLTVETFADEDEAVRLANEAVGLAGAVWSQD